MSNAEEDAGSRDRHAGEVEGDVCEVEVIKVFSTKGLVVLSFIEKLLFSCARSFV